MNMIDVDENKNNVVVKHKELIDEARYKLSELGIKIVAVLISMIRIDDDDLHQYTLRIDDFRDLIGSDSKNTYKYTHKLISELLSKSLKIKDEQFAWISYGKYEEGTNLIHFEINRHLKPYLLALKGNFVKYDISNILPLRSSYVIRFYELLHSKLYSHLHYRPKAKSCTFEIKIDWLRKQFEIPDSYQYSSHIKKLIIEKAKKEFKAKTDIQFTYVEQKIGRKVDRIIVIVKKNDNDFLKNRKKFIIYLREKYLPDPTKNHYPTVVSTKDGDIKIDLNGHLYLSEKSGTKDYSSEQSDKLWSWLYENAKNGNISV